MNNPVDFNELFNDSYEHIMKNDEQFFSDFYNLFTSSSPKVRDAFKNTDIHRQRRMLRSAIAYMTNFFVTKIADDYLIKIGKHHKNVLEIEPQFYELFITTLLISLKNNYRHYNEKCGIAWRITLSPGIELMKHAANIEDGD